MADLTMITIGNVDDACLTAVDEICYVETILMK